MTLKQVVYIAATPYSGSTLLDLLLRQPEGCMSLGEVHRLGMSPLRRVQSFGNRCSCGARLHECTHWEGLRARMMKSVGFAPPTDWSEWGVTTRFAYAPSAKSVLSNWVLRGLVLPELRFGETLWQGPLFAEYWEAEKNSWSFFRHLAAASGRETLIDSTKTAARLHALWRHNVSQLKVIHLVRDGRGVAHSYMKRTAQGIDAGVRFWKRRSRPLSAVLRRIPSEQIRRVRYEDVGASPVEELERICGFLEVGFDADSVSLPASPPHVIPGNPMSSRVATGIAVNTEWRTALSQSDLDFFARRGAKLNASFGYS